jgi:hypothetical protein
MRKKIIRWLIIPTILLLIIGGFFTDNIAFYVEHYPDYGLWPLVDDLLVTYGYYGETLSSQDIIYRYENNVSMHCVEAPAVTSKIIPIATRFEYFDTTAEANAYSASSP